MFFTGSNNLLVEQSSDPKCSKPARFRTQNYRPWFDPSNWIPFESDDQSLGEKIQTDFKPGSFVLGKEYRLKNIKLVLNFLTVHYFNWE